MDHGTSLPGWGENEHLQGQVETQTLRRRIPSTPSLNAPFHDAFPLVKNPRNSEFYPSPRRTRNNARRLVHLGEVSNASHPPKLVPPRLCFTPSSPPPPIFCFPGSALDRQRYQHPLRNSEKCAFSGLPNIRKLSLSYVPC